MKMKTIIKVFIKFPPTLRLSDFRPNSTKSCDARSKMNGRPSVALEFGGPAAPT
jgi:hypothetical protein